MQNPDQYIKIFFETVFFINEYRKHLNAVYSLNLLQKSIKNFSGLFYVNSLSITTQITNALILFILFAI